MNENSMVAQIISNLKKVLRLPSVLVLAMGISSTALAADFATPSGAVVLTVSGNIGVSNRGKEAVFDFVMLEAMSPKTVKTTTPWTKGVTIFRGPLLRDILKAVAADGTIIVAAAIDDYKVEIPLKDAMDYDVILAISHNGKRMRVRDKGPLWIIYPWSDEPELNDERYFARSIWQLKSIHVQ
jgi:hypothetical protein